MKKMTVMVDTKESKKAEVSVYLEEQTAEVLEKYGNERIIREYILSQKLENNAERRETRNHISLDNLLELGWEPFAKQDDLEEKMLHTAQVRELYKAMKKLTERQRIVLIGHAVYMKTFRQLGATIGVDESVARGHYWAGIKKIKKILTKTPPQKSLFVAYK